MKKHIVWTILLVVAVALLLALYPGQEAERQQRLQLAIGYGLAILIFLYGFAILLGIASGEIKIDTLLSESGGGASMSRFQLLIFTLVIALSLFFIVAKSGTFPVIPTEILTLLGISATTYGVSKGIQAASPDLKPKDGGDDGTTTVTTTTQTTPTTATTATTQQTTP